MQAKSENSNSRATANVDRHDLCLNEEKLPIQRPRAESLRRVSPRILCTDREKMTSSSCPRGSRGERCGLRAGSGAQSGMLKHTAVFFSTRRLRASTKERPPHPRALSLLLLVVFPRPPHVSRKIASRRANFAREKGGGARGELGNRRRNPKP